ncbi:MAG: alpha/beta hydrolase [Bacteroidota bacterium]
MTILFIIIGVITLLAVIGRSSIERLQIPTFKASNQIYPTGKNRVEFKSRGKTIVGNLFIPDDYKEGGKRPAMVIAPPATSLKEHAAGFYAEKFVKKGYITLSIDTRGIGESEGIQCDVDPYHHANDVASAVSFLESLKQVDDDKLFNVGVCAGGVASPYATIHDKRIKAQGLITPSIAGPELMKSTVLPVRIIIYIVGGLFNFLKIFGLNVKLPAIPNKIPQGDSAPARGMQEISTYYLPGKVGHHERWINNTSATSLPGVARLHIFNHAKALSSIPVVQVVGKEAYSYEPAMRFYNMLTGTKELLEIENTNHVDFYYKDEVGNQAVDKIDSFFKRQLNYA